MQFFDEITEKQAKLLNPLTLAFVGDAVQTLYVRERLTKAKDVKANALHKLTSQEVKSDAQAQRADELMPLLSEQEKEIFRRARNSKSNNVAKNSTLEHYKKASGLEAVFGYLYLTGQQERLGYLLGIHINEE